MKILLIVLVIDVLINYLTKCYIKNDSINQSMYLLIHKTSVSQVIYAITKLILITILVILAIMLILKIF